MDLFKDVSGFEWDAGNRDKNRHKHDVSNEECEEVFFDPHKRFLKSDKSDSSEERFILVGKTKFGRLLFIVFVFRRKKIRVISARDLNKREYHLYEKET